MSDPRNAAHDKKVAQEKKHHSSKKHASSEQDAAPHDHEATPSETAAADANTNTTPAAKGPAPELEGSLVILAQLKDLAFHANAHQGRLAEMMLTVEDKLKQKELAATMGDLYALQAELHDKLTAFITEYSAECDRLQTSGA